MSLDSHLGSSQKVLLVGGNGFIGKALTHYLLSNNYRIKIADITTPEASIDRIEYCKGSIEDPSFINESVQGCDYVVHLAHRQLLLQVDCDMDLEYQHNILPAIHLMDACIKAKVKKLILLSSGGTVYGQSPSGTLLTETSPTEPISVYGTSKLIIEQIAKLYQKQKQLPVSIARPANAYGPGQQPYMGQGVIATAFASAIDGKPLEIYGDGSAVRDYIHVRDIAIGISHLLQYQGFGTYNVGTGKGTSLKQLVSKFIIPIARADGFELECHYSSNRTSDVPYNVLSCKQMNEDVGFAADTDLWEGLLDTWNWIKKIKHI